MSDNPITKAEQLHRAALRREGEAYAAVGAADRLALVNAELQRVGEPTIAMPSMDAARQTRKSASAATRTKRST